LVSGKDCLKEGRKDAARLPPAGSALRVASRDDGRRPCPPISRWNPARREDGDAHIVTIAGPKVSFQHLLDPLTKVELRYGLPIFTALLACLNPAFSLDPCL